MIHKVKKYRPAIMLMQQKGPVFLFFLLCLGLTFSAPVKAADFPDPPSPPRLVMDYTHTLSPEETASLESKLRQYHDTTSTQIAVVLMESVGGYEINDYAARLGDKWGVGQKGKDNGVLVLVALADRQVSIQLGYGAEGAIPDMYAKKIIDRDIVPAFKQRHYYEGLDKATDDIILLLKGEFIAEPGRNPAQGFPFQFLLFAFIILVILMLRVGSARKYARINHIPFWTAWALMNASRGRHQGRWGSFSGGGGSGFGGFGGGGFGGGGASGKW